MLQGTEELNRTVEEYWRIVVRRRWWLLLPFSAIAVATVVISFLLPETYRSETVILVENQRVPEHYVVSNVSTELGNRLNGMTQQILSRTRLLQTIDEFNLFAQEKQELAPEEVVERMRKSISIEMIRSNQRRDPDSFKLAFLARDPRLAQQVLSRLTSLFIEENLRVREQLSRSTTQFLETQLEQARHDLQRQEERLREFKMKYLGELPEQRQGNVQILSGLQMQMQQVGAALNRAREQGVYLETLLGQYQSLAEAERNSGSPGLGPGLPIEDELARLRRERADLLARYTEKHPDVLKIKDRLEQAEALQAQLAKERKTVESDQSSEGLPDARSTSQLAATSAQLESQLKANRIEIDNLVAQQERLASEMRQYKNRLNLTPLREQQLADVMRNHNLSKRNYEGLLKKKLESELATDMEERQQGEQFRILDPPSLPEKPYRPNRGRISAIGAVLGLGLAVGLMFLVEIRDRTVFTEKQLSSSLPLPWVLGIPALPTPAEVRRQRHRQLWGWVAGSALVLLAAAAEMFVLLRG